MSVRVKVIGSRPADAPRPKVSVAMVTYKHEKFITQAVESVMMQQTDFPYELVIGEDCSPDRTREIVVDLQRRYPDRIRLLLPDRNLGMRANDLQTLRACDGEDVAILEGDDFWTSREKLKKQVRFLECHPECSACFHPVTQICDDGRKEPVTVGLSRDKRFFSLEDLISQKLASTCSVMYRNYFKGIFPEWYHKIGFGDWALQILHAEHGLLGYFDEVMASYRVHAGGVWSTTSRTWQLEQLVFLYESLNHYLGVKYRAQVRQCLSRRSYQLSVHYLAAGRVAEARRCAWRSLVACPFNPTVSLAKRSKQIMLSLAPFAGRAWTALRAIKTPASGIQHP